MSISAGLVTSVPRAHWFAPPRPSTATQAGRVLTHVRVWTRPVLAIAVLCGAAGAAASAERTLAPVQHQQLTPSVTHSDIR